MCPPRECHQPGDGGLPGGGIDHTCVVGLLGTTMLPLASYMERREVYHVLQWWELVFVSIALTSGPISLPHVPSVALRDKGQNLILT